MYLFLALKMIIVKKIFAMNDYEKDCEIIFVKL